MGRARSRPAVARARSASTGFTLVELLIVLSILVITAALVVPSAASASITRLRSAAALLVADLEYAQLESIAHPDDRRVVVFDTDAARYRIATAAIPDTPLTHPATKRPFTITFGTGAASQFSGVAISSVSFSDDDTLGFGPYGQLDQTTAAVITLTAGSRSITITLDPTTGDPTISDIQ